MFVTKVLGALDILEVIENSNEEVVELGVLLDVLNVFAFSVSENDVVELFSLFDNISLLFSSINFEGKVSALNQGSNIDRCFVGGHDLLDDLSLGNIVSDLSDGASLGNLDDLLVVLSVRLSDGLSTVIVD